MALLEVTDLTMYYQTRKGEVKAVDEVSFELETGDSLGLVGESGCGKTSIAFSVLRLLPENGEIKGGEVLFDGIDLITLPEEKMRKVRWRGISMVFQAAMNSLNPVYKVGDQIIEAIQTHNHLGDKEARRRVAELFQLVGLDPEVSNQYPHEYSGGMKQRVVIAMALSCEPDMIIADEPTTALDVIVQDKILKEMDKIRDRLDMSMMYISHDIAVIAEVSDQIGIMYAGKLVEFADTVSIFKKPIHPYTKALMSAFPSIKGEKKELETLGGEPPNLIEPPSGCRFHPRCPNALPRCERKEPNYEQFKENHLAACWNPVQK